MNILFVCFGELSIKGGAMRAVSMVRALAEAGHRIDIVAADAELQEHPNIGIIEGGGTASASRHRLRMAVLRATGRKSYDCLHGVDEAVVFLSRIARFRKTKLVYAASRCFTGTMGIAPSRLWNLLPGYFSRLEKRILLQASMVLSSCPALSSDLRGLAQETRINQIEDIPAQSMFCGRILGRSALLDRFKGKSSSVVVCSILPGNRKELRKLLMATRKVIESIPHASFFFKGSLVEEAEKMAANLDILGRCSFLLPEETEAFLSALDIADAVLLVPQPGGRYLHQEVFTLLQAPAPLVAVQSPAYGKLLTDLNSIQVLPSSEAMAEGLLRAIQEPLFSLGIATEGQQLIADNYSFSSFKHKVRMVYHGLLKKD
ncbi:hypothetical protein PDESU_02269 [Pontiella desulfatans]|uniref:Uncharacterized protein n=1 Tax=Pontiella desulfatans TaxID=2750659 RepID=A0A6C2U192_PONDE|nr:glycosyltransferase [Pontiella desulfatans]VGO13712.1 hypothetical protein PDESU_02269 [Pontiella desulfatans]